MVFKLQLRFGHRLPILIAVVSAAPALALAEGPSSAQLLQDARSLYQQGQYFKAARYAFAASDPLHELKSAQEAEAYSWVALSLIRSGLRHSASYFFIKTLQAGNPSATRRVLTETQPILDAVGDDLLRKYLIRHTRYEDYDAENRSAYLLALAKEALLTNQNDKAVGYLNGMSRSSPLFPTSLLLRGTARAILGQSENSISDFQLCQNRAGKNRDLLNRCIAGEARALYQSERFEEAELVWDRIPKSSIVWTDILFEQAWNAFAKNEFNRALGKLVSYKSPALKFVFNTETDVLRAQSYFTLCLYDDARKATEDFYAHYSSAGEQIKRFVEGNSTNLGVFFDLGKAAFRDSLYSQNPIHQMANRFIRSPYFQRLITSEREIQSEAATIQQFLGQSPRLSALPQSMNRGFPGFVSQVLKWRMATLRSLGGAFVKNGLLDYHSRLISDVQKMDFIKLSLLEKEKNRILQVKRSSGREVGGKEPFRKEYQYYWSFNGEFWNDELGDYVFGLESQCRQPG